MITKSPAARTALIYVTVGALTIIWTGVWYVYLHNNPPVTNGPYYFCGGLMASGLIMLLLGFGLGRLGRSAQHAELPPPELTVPPAPVAPVAPVEPAIPPAAPVPPETTAASPRVDPKVEVTNPAVHRRSRVISAP
jgi:hypothetical protein